MHQIKPSSRNGTIKAALLYFAFVFGAGFLFAMVRIPFIVPRLGVRWAELLEMPMMLIVIVMSARFIVRRFALTQRSARLVAGIIALVLLITAELLLAAILEGQHPAAYVASRDPVSGAVYAAMLLLFAAMPLLWPTRPHPPTASQSPRTSHDGD